MNKVEQQKKCNQCEGHEDELQKEIQLTYKFKRQNDQLRQNLKDISKDLDKKLQEKTKMKQIGNKPQTSQRSQIEVLEEQIQNAKKQVKQYQATLNTYQKKSKVEYSMEKANELYEEIKTKKEILKEFQLNEKKLLQEKRVSEQRLLKDKPEKQVNILREEIMVLNNRIAQQKKQYNSVKQNYENQQINILKLTEKHKELCSQTGVSYQPIIIQKKEDLNKQSSQDQKLSIKQKNQKINEQYEKYTRMQQQISILQKNQDESMKKHNQKIKLLESQILQIEEEKNKLSEQLQKMEKVLEVENQKLKEIQNNIKQMSLLEKDPGIRKTQAGVSFASQNARSFRDSSELQIPGDMFISQVTLTSYKNFIIGLEVVYKSRKGIEKQKIGFQPKNQIENQIVQSMKLSSIEHVQNITGYYSTHIDYLKIISSRGQYIYGGIDKLQSHQQKFSIEIKKDEKPQSFFGTVDLINEEIQQRNHASELNNEFVLVTIGCELKKKDTIGGLKNNKRYLTRNEKDNINNNRSNYYDENENLQQKSISTQRQSLSQLSQKNSQQLLQNMNQQSQQQQENQYIQKNEKLIQQQQQNQKSENEYNNESDFQYNNDNYESQIKNSQLQQQVQKKKSYSDNNNSEQFNNQENEVVNNNSEQDVENQDKNESQERTL